MHSRMEERMLNRLALAMTTAALLATGPAVAQSQQEGAGSTPGHMMQQGDGQGMPMMQGHQAGMMQGHGMMHGRGMMGGDSGPGMGRNMMLMMMALIDTDGSETLSLEEVQAAHARIFQYADTDDDGELTMQELRGFMHSGGEAPAR